MHRFLRQVMAGAGVIMFALGATLAQLGQVTAAADTVTEIHYSYGNTSDSVWFDWDGSEQNIYYGPDTNYGQTAVASASPVTPVDSAGPFMQVQLTGLTAGTTYHYKIGATGLDHTFSTIPTGSFTWGDMGDTTSAGCEAWESQVQSLMASQNPTFVTHGGDISYANDCGVQAVHQFYTDIEAWSHGAAFQPAWGNHEYGQPGCEGSLCAPTGTPQDSMLNYKGRSFMTNGQTVPNDTSTKTTNPGCGWETGSSTNTCQGNDWGWFQAGHVLFINYPEPWFNAYPAWQTAADSLMATAQADPNVDFIVTYGHRPAYSSSTTDVDTNLQTAINNLAVKYSPTTSNPTGKYVLNVNHHVHWSEVFKPINGLVNVTDGGGGAGQAAPTTIDPNSIFHMTNPAMMVAKYDATNHTLNYSLLCGPAFTPNPKADCTYGSVLFSQTFKVGGSTQAQQWIGNQSVETDMTGWNGTYGGSPYVTVTRDSGAAHTGTWSIKVTGLTGASNLSSGFNDNPRWVTNTVAGTTYSQNAWVDPTFVGQKISLRLKEWNGNTLVADKFVTLTAAKTGWQQLAQSLTAVNSGDQLSFAIYSNSISAGQFFYADDFSLTSP